MLALLVAGWDVNAAAATLFQDNFEDGNTTGWSFVGSNQGNWNASGGVLHHGGGYDSKQAIALINGITTPSIFTLEADVSVQSNRYGWPDWGHVGLAWGVTPGATLGFNTSYLRTHEDRVTNWSMPYASGGERFLNTPGTVNEPTYHLRVDVDSIARSMTVALDGWQTTFTGADFDLINQNSGGGIGLMSWSDNVTFDNIQVSTPVPLPGAFWLFGSGIAGISAIRRKRK